jgi:hypothetical protein
MTAFKGGKNRQVQKLLYVSRFTSWAPGINSPASPSEKLPSPAENWREWARGNRQISGSRDSPSLEFTESLFRRRLSQISRMTIQVIHDLMPLEETTKIVFLSFRGEITRQFNINKMIIEEHSLMPAAFSQSVFNTPPALAAIALNLRAGYTAVYPGAAGTVAADTGEAAAATDAERFTTGFLAAAAPLLCGSAEEILLVYADELCPPEYGSLCPPVNEALAFAAMLSLKKEAGAIPIESPYRPGSERDFLKYLYLYK